MAGAGGHLQPLAFMGDDAVAPAVAPLGVPCSRIPAEFGMGRILGGVFRRLSGMRRRQWQDLVRRQVSSWLIGDRTATG